MQSFRNDEAYPAWVRAHSDGFVLNLRQRRDSDYVVLHRASCHLICREPDKPGAYTERHYRKIAALSVEALREAARMEGRHDGSFSKSCSTCQPSTTG